MFKYKHLFLQSHGTNTFVVICFTFSLSDNEKPSFECPANQEIVANYTSPLPLVTWPDPEVTDNSGDTPEVICYPPSGSNFTIGETSVSCSAEDKHGNVRQCSFSIHILGRYFVIDVDLKLKKKL